MSLYVSLGHTFLGRCISWPMFTFGNNPNKFLGQCVPLTMPPLENASLGRHIPRKMAPLDDASLGQCVPDRCACPNSGFHRGWCRVDVSQTDVFPTENSWLLQPLNKASLGYCAPDQCVPTLDHVKHGTGPLAAIAASVGLRHLMGQWDVWLALPTPLAKFIGLAPLRRMHARPIHRTPPLRSTKARYSW